VSLGGDILTALCGNAPWAGGLLLGLFVAGAAGSTMHCVPMCGGFVLGQAADGMARLPAVRLCEWQRIRLSNAGACPGIGHRELHGCRIVETHPF
jgi:hypothetical protein